MTDSPPNFPSLDSLRKMREADEVLARREARHRAAMDEIIKRRRAISEWVSQTEALFRDIDDLVGDIDEDDATPSPEVSEKSQPEPPKKRGKRVLKGAWTTTIKELVEQADRPVRYDELRDMIQKTDLADTLKKTEKSFYGAIGRLANNDEIVREDGYVFSHEAYERYQQDLRDGGKPLPKSHHGHASPAADEIKAYLRTRPTHGATSAEIIEHLKTTEVRESIENNKSFAYNVISRLSGRKEIIKAGKRYRLPDENEEAPDGAGASRSVGVAGSPDAADSHPGPVGSTPTTSTTQSGAGSAPSDSADGNLTFRQMFNP